MATAQLLNPNDMSSTEDWNTTVTAASSTSVTITGPVYSATFTGNFVISGESISGTVTGATQFKNKVAQYARHPQFGGDYLFFSLIPAM